MLGIKDVNRHPVVHTWSYKLAEQVSPLDNLGQILAMNLFRLFRNIPQQTTARVCDDRIARSESTAIETLS
jgi:hypothetical protein